MPLLIAHPLSPFKGQHYKDPVELLDVFPTMNDLLAAPYDEKTIYKGHKHILPQGKSLAPIILGREMWEQLFPSRNGTVKFKPQRVTGVNASLPLSSNAAQRQPPLMPALERNYAITQSSRCAKKANIPAQSSLESQLKAIEANSGGGAGVGGVKSGGSKKIFRRAVWEDCSIDYKGNDEISLLGYSLRTPDYRYTAYFHYNKTSFLGRAQVNVDRMPFQHELFEHKNETLEDFTHREFINLANKPNYAIVVKSLRSKLVDFIMNEAVFHNQNE